jgi:hypothetical protein
LTFDGFFAPKEIVLVLDLDELILDLDAIEVDTLESFSMDTIVEGGACR